MAHDMKNQKHGILLAMFYLSAHVCFVELFRQHLLKKPLCTSIASSQKAALHFDSIFSKIISSIGSKKTEPLFCVLSDFFCILDIYVQ